MTVLLFIAVFAVIGGLLYLPFFLWFRWRRPRPGTALSARVDMPPAGWLFLIAQLACLFAGLALLDRHPQGSLAALFEGKVGLLKWWICTLAVFGLLSRLLRGAGVVLDRPRRIEPETPTPAALPTPQPRRYKVAKIRGIPVFVQRSYLYGGLLIALIAQAGPAGIAGYCVAYAALFALHEAGHAVAARLLGLHVHAIDLSAVGGACLVQLPRRPSDAWLLYSAGLAVQAVLLAATLSAVAVAGAPESPFAIAVVATFTWVNALIFLVNLVPGRTALGPRSDGSMLWALARHRFNGGPHPLAELMAASPVFDPSTNLLDMPDLVPEGFRDGVAIYNDDTTPMAFVAEMLRRHLGLDAEAAAAAMLAIHTRGALLLPLASREAAVSVADAITRHARAEGLQLACRAVAVPA